MKIKIIKLTVPKPEKRHGVRVRGIYNVLPGKESDKHLYNQHPGGVWIETDDGRVRIKKEEFEEVKEEDYQCKGCKADIERYPSKKEKLFECETSGCHYIVKHDGTQEFDFDDREPENKEEPKEEEIPENCHFTHNLADSLECSQDGKFDENGFAVNACPLFPCERYKRVDNGIEDLSKEYYLLRGEVACQEKE